MQELGRFKLGQKKFYGLVEKEQVSELQNSPWENFKTTSLTESWNELVILSPCEPSKILVRKNKEGFLRAPSALLPHRNMISIPFPDHPNHCEAGLGIVIGKMARRIKATDSSNYILGYTALQSVSDNHFPPTQAHSYDTFMPIGPTIKTEIAQEGKMELWHNGELKQQTELAALLKIVPDWLAEVSDAMTLWPGDILALTLSENAPTLKPGDHVEVIIHSLRNLATNVGMRGSA
ncbi:MAG: fumarylacetoacetate hydrolase family protein [Verrucomicrobiae bacterium]|nr:fumarylacetoacetate hydrolase family protein [Verrucomicrobiae bacterium]